MATKEEKLKLIRKCESVVGFSKFKVSKKSSDEELNEVLEFIHVAIDDASENLIPQIRKIIDEVHDS